MAHHPVVSDVAPRAAAAGLLDAARLYRLNAPFWLDLARRSRGAGDLAAVRVRVRRRHAEYVASAACFRRAAVRLPG